MPYTKKFFIELTTLEPIKDNHVFDVIKKNFPKSYLKLIACNEVLLKDLNSPMGIQCQNVSKKFNEIDRHEKNSKQTTVV